MKNNSQNLVIRGAQILTMDDTIGDFENADIHIKSGSIHAVGKGVDAAGAEEVDGADLIVMPGFVDTHWHLWECALRGHVRGDDSVNGYFPLTTRVGSRFSPEDSYNSVLAGCTEALMSGITTLHNWANNLTTPAHADAEIKALKDSGVRARFSYGPSKILPNSTPYDIREIERVHSLVDREPLLTMGVAVRTPLLSGAPGFSIETLKKELESLRAKNIPLTMHAGPKGLVDLLAKNGVLGSDLLLIHPQGMTESERTQLAQTQTKYSIAPLIEMSYSAVRNGYIQFAELEALHIQLGLSIDSSAASASTDFFNIMRTLMWSNWQRPDSPPRVAPHRLLQLATIDGARLLGLDKETGSLTPGKKADLITIRKTDVNIAPVVDPYFSIVYSGQPANIESVFVGGKLMCQRGELVNGDVRSIVQNSAASGRRAYESAATVAA